MPNAPHPPQPHQDAELPRELQVSVQRHRQHLVALATSLRAIGVDEDSIDASVRQLVASYGIELTAAMRTLVQGGLHV